MKNKFNKFLMIILSILFLCSAFFTGCENFNNSGGNSGSGEVDPNHVFTPNVHSYAGRNYTIDNERISYETFEIDGKQHKRYIVEENLKYRVYIDGYEQPKDGSQRIFPFYSSMVVDYNEDIVGLLDNDLGFETKEVDEDTLTEIKLKSGTYTCSLYIKIIDTTSIENINEFTVSVSTLTGELIGDDIYKSMEPIFPSLEYETIEVAGKTVKRYIVENPYLFITLFPTVSELDGKARYINKRFVSISSVGDVHQDLNSYFNEELLYIRDMDIAIQLLDVNEETEREITFTYKDFSTTVYFLQKPTKAT